MTVNLDIIRRDTPACDRLLHFNNAGASLMPRPVYDAMSHYLALEQSIGGYEAAAQSTDAISRFYTAFAALLNADPDEIAFVESATRAWDMAVYAIDFQPGDRVLLHATEYSSNYLALLQISRSKGIIIDHVPSDPDGQIDCAVLETLITNKTKAVFLTHAPSQSGLINPAKAVGVTARKHGLIYVLDACQSLGQMPVNVQEIGCDILCGTGRKFLRGPRGTGVLFVSRRIMGDLHPPFIDLHSASWTSTHEYTLRPDAKRFEAWERFMAGQIALGEAARYASAIGLDVIQTRIGQLSQRLREKLTSIKGITVRDQGRNKSGIVTFSFDGMDAGEAVTLLRRQHINTSAARVEHARLDLEARNLTTLMRASVHYYNTDTEVDRFCDAIQTLC